MWFSKEKPAPFRNKTPLFSEMPENKALAEKIREISGPRVSIATDFLGDPQSPCVSLRHQAEYRDDEHCWDLIKVTRIDGEGDLKGLSKRQTLAKTDCFFDALHWCSVFQASAEKNSEIIVPEGEHWSDFRRWQDIAKEAGQALSDSGIAQPCMGGKPLTDGYFRDEQLAVAKKTKNSLAATFSEASRFKAGEMIEGKGIFLGFYDPGKDQTSWALSRVREQVGLFSAPTDAKEADGKTNLCLSFDKMARHIAGLRNWHGHDGAKLKDRPWLGFGRKYEDALRDMLRGLKEGEGTGWFIGTRPIIFKQIVLHNHGPEKIAEPCGFKGFLRKKSHWSCTEYENNPVFAYLISFDDTTIRNDAPCLKEYEYSSRPVRAERFRP